MLLLEGMDILYENNECLIINKPAGMLVHGILSKKSNEEDKKKEETVVDWLLKHYPKVKKVGDAPLERPGIVHRLDKDTSGVLLIAKTQDFFDYAKNLFQTHEIKKTYCALVHGLIEKKGRIDVPIGLKAGSTKRSVHGRNMKMIKEAITDYEPIKCYSYITTLSSKREKEEWVTLLRAFPKTGRTHQIRVHLASIHHPIVGDALYGPKKNTFGLTHQFLHAESIEFSQSNGKRISVSAELPKELQSVLDHFSK